MSIGGGPPLSSSLLQWLKAVGVSVGDTSQAATSQSAQSETVSAQGAASSSPLAGQTSSTGGLLPYGNGVSTPVLMSAQQLTLLAMRDSMLSRLQIKQWGMQLMKLPEEPQKLLTELIQEATQQVMTAEELTQLLNDPQQAKPKLPLAELQKTLTAKLQGLGQEVSKLMLQQGQNPAGRQALNDLLQMTTTLTAQVNNSPVEALQTLMVLALPIHPWMQPTPLEVGFKEGGEGSDGEVVGQDAPLILYLQTVVLGRFKVTLVPASAEQGTVVLTEHESAATPFTDQLQADTLEAINHGPSPGFVWETFKGASDTPTQVKPKPVSLSDAADQLQSSVNSKPSSSSSAQQQLERNLSYYPQEGVSVELLSIGFAFSRIVFELDEKLETLRQRKSKLSQ